MSSPLKESTGSGQAIANLLESMPEPVQKSFSQEQLKHLENAIIEKRWNKHGIDVRGKFRWLTNGYYFVLLAGKNSRNDSREDDIPKLKKYFYLILFFSLCVGLGLLTLFILKTIFGLELFDNFSLGILKGL